MFDDSGVFSKTNWIYWVHHPFSCLDVEQRGWNVKTITYDKLAQLRPSRRSISQRHLGSWSETKHATVVLWIFKSFTNSSDTKCKQKMLDLQKLHKQFRTKNATKQNNVLNPIARNWLRCRRSDLSQVIDIAESNCKSARKRSNIGMITVSSVRKCPSTH